MKFKRKIKKYGWWSDRFAWLPKKALLIRDKNYKNSHSLQTVWIWLEYYERYFNYGAPVNYYHYKGKLL